MTPTNKPKRIVVVADLHCGHRAGLTPPAFQEEHGTRLSTLQAECWQFYATTLRSLQPIDVLVANGDLIDGSGKKSGGTELLTTDRLVQCDMAAECLLAAKASRTVMTFGTAYHTGAEEDFEQIIADKVGAEKIGSHEWLTCNGVVFDVKHHCGSSSVPHARHTAVARERLWNQLWAERSQQPKANVLIRSHVHYHVYSGGTGWVAMTTPALQAASTKYGARRCSGTIDFGLIVFDVEPNGDFKWKALTAELFAQRAQPILV